MPLRLHLRSPAPGSERVSNPRSVLAQARACAHLRRRDRAREKRVCRSARRRGKGGPVCAYQSSRSARRRAAPPSASGGAERWPRGRLCRSPRCGGDAHDPTAPRRSRLLPAQRAVRRQAWKAASTPPDPALSASLRRAAPKVGGSDVYDHAPCFFGAECSLARADAVCLVAFAKAGAARAVGSGPT